MLWRIGHWPIIKCSPMPPWLSYTLGFESLDSCFPEDYAQEVSSLQVVNFRQGGVLSETCDYTKSKIWQQILNIDGQICNQWR
jgi:hypothetical protein